jgi:hypothetical protein
MFPNLREISFSTYTNDDPQIDASKCLQFSHAICKLEKIKDFGSCELAPQLAMSDLCNKLKTLELDFGFCSVPGGASNFISQLKNMPVLEDLSMNDIKFKLIDLETMHSNLPSLKRLCLKSVYPTSGEIPRDVVPASLITEMKVKIQHAETQHTRIQFYNYIGNKYPSLRNPIFDDCIYSSEEGTGIIPHIYNEGIFPLYQKIGSQVDTFIFNDYCDGLDAFRKFDDYGMKLKELTINMYWMFEDVQFIEELAQSQQSKYIQKLTLCDIFPNPIYMINNLEVLDTLDISGSFVSAINGQVMRRKINFTQLIDTCPATLSTLRINNINLAFHGPASNLTSIKHLEITNVKMTPVLAEIIETSFPSLSTLTLSCNITNNVTISLLEHKLKDVSITVVHNEEEEANEYTIESKCEDDIHYHIIKRTLDNNNDGQVYVYNGRTDHSAETGLKKSFALEFICPSVEQLLLFIQ